MESTLGSRFKKIAKGFGKGLLGAVAGGGWLGIATTVIDKLLNPLKEVQDSIDKTLSGADDVVTNAEQFNSTPGELFKLQKMAQAKGLDAESLNNLIMKFQGAVAEAAQDPNKQTSVRAFANDTNMVQSFFEFIKSMNTMDRNKQVTVQQEVFGEKQTLKMAEFMRADFAALSQQLGVKNATSYNPGLEKLGALNDLSAALKAKRELGDMNTKSGIINSGMITARDAADKLELKKENERIANYKNLQSITDTSNKILGLLEQALFKFGELINFLIPSVNKLIGQIEKISKSGWVRGIFGGGK